MSDIISNIFGQATDSSADETLSYSAMASAAAGAGAYLAATLQATTPELRAILGGFVSQKVLEHDTITEYVMNKGWMNPYDDPSKQLESTFKQSNSMMGRH
ncbi:MAG: spore coat protein [Syntrophomonadaceae bacterium]|nr:spore coat protein [Syntrophomonadaceae bacterium]